MMELYFRNATKNDLTALVQILGAHGMKSRRAVGSPPINPRYIEVFTHINSDPNNELIVASLNEDIVGMLQLTFIPYLTYIGSWRCYLGT